MGPGVRAALGTTVVRHLLSGVGTSDGIMKTLPVTVLSVLLLSQLSFSSYRLSPVINQSGIAPAASEEVPTVAFCEVAKNPQRYFDKAVRLTATLVQATEARYLRDDECPQSRDGQTGVGYVATDEKQSAARNRILEKMRAPEYGGKARVTVVGFLRNSSRRDFAWYQYRFDILRFEDVAHVTVPYEGKLQGGVTYLATVRGDERDGLSLVIPLRMPEHYAVRIEWTNLNEFPALGRLLNGPREQQIVFSVISDQITQMTERRWNRTLRCKVISVE